MNHDAHIIAWRIAMWELIEEIAWRKRRKSEKGQRMRAATCKHGVNKINVCTDCLREKFGGREHSFAAPSGSANRDGVAKKIHAAVWDELGGYEVSHPWMSGATDAVTARVMVILTDNNFWPNK